MIEVNSFRFQPRNNTMGLILSVVESMYCDTHTLLRHGVRQHVHRDTFTFMCSFDKIKPGPHTERGFGKVRLRTIEFWSHGLAVTPPHIMIICQKTKSIRAAGTSSKFLKRSVTKYWLAVTMKQTRVFVSHSSSS